MSWLIPTAFAAFERPQWGSTPSSVNVCKSFFNFLRLPCAGEAGADDKTSSLYGLIVNIIVFLLEIAASVSLALIVYAGFLYISASANPEQAKKARTILTWSLVGLVIVMSAFLITSAVKALVYGMNFSA